MLIDPGTAVGAGIDRLDVHKDSNLYISYEESSQNSSGDGIIVNIQNSTVDVQGGEVNTKIVGYDGTGLLVDYLETTNFDDTVVNNGTVGMIVNLSKNYDATDFDYFTGTAVASQVDVLDARLNNSLEFSTYDEFSNGSSIWTEISGYNELNPYVDGDAVYALVDTTHGVGVLEITYFVRKLALIMQLRLVATLRTGFYKDIPSSQQL